MVSEIEPQVQGRPFNFVQGREEKMNRIKKVFIGAAATAAAWVAGLPVALAIEIPQDPTVVVRGGGEITSVFTWFNVIFQLLTAAAGVVFIILLIVGGFQYLTGAGNEEATGKAKKLMIDAVIGLIITLIAYAAGYWILGKLGLHPRGTGVII